MFGWLKKMYRGARNVIGRVKSGVEGGAKLFTRGKEMYGKVKNFASNLPIVGTVAKELIAGAEDYANKEAKSRLGADFSDLNKAVGMAEGVARYLPRG
jgi:hypothetical protein